jgi:hypothetical protein
MRCARPGIADPRALGEQVSDQHYGYRSTNQSTKARSNAKVGTPHPEICRRSLANVPARCFCACFSPPPRTAKCMERGEISRGCKGGCEDCCRMACGRQSEATCVRSSDSLGYSTAAPEASKRATDMCEAFLIMPQRCRASGPLPSVRLPV